MCGEYLWVLLRMIGFISIWLHTLNYVQIGAIRRYRWFTHCPLFTVYRFTHQSFGNVIKGQELALQITPNITHEESLPITLEVFERRRNFLFYTELRTLSPTKYFNSLDFQPRTECKRASVSPRNPWSNTRKNCCVLLPCCRDMFIAALRSNMGRVARLGGRGAARRGSARPGRPRHTSTRHEENTTFYCCVTAGTHLQWRCLYTPWANPSEYLLLHLIFCDGNFYLQLNFLNNTK
jgi:hypothetical protein